MNTSPRRSPRFQSQARTAQPLFSSVPSYNSVSSQSSSIVSSAQPSPNAEFAAQLNPLYLQPQSFNAPLPSPSANDINPFDSSQRQSQSTFGQATMGGQSQQQSNTSSYQANSGQSKDASQHNQHHNSFSSTKRPNNPATNADGMPPGLPADFLAEAAKRAQMACLMRDLGDVSL